MKKLELSISLITILSTILFAQGKSNIPPIEIKQYFDNVRYCTTGVVTGSGRMFALLIGINQPNKDFQKLSGPSREIKELSGFLESQQYCVKALINNQATKAAVEAWLEIIQ